MFEMTYNQALAIQEKQIKWYSRDGGPLTQAGIDKIKAMTKPCPGDPDEIRPVIEINQLVPRGGDIEHVCGISSRDYD